MTCICNRNHVDDDEHTPACQQHSELTTLRAQVAALDERVRLLNAECWAWRKHDKAQWDYVNGNGGAAKRAGETQAKLTECTSASDAASAVKEPA